ncbi:MAG: N-acetyltransferase [Woeseiaceae bacterium]|nr:N-acetyltransferase [Woeseiaceae bacterium]
MAAIRVREAAGEDVSALSSVGREAFAAAYRGTAPDSDIERHLVDYFGAAAIREALRRDDVTYFIAEDGSRCAGLVKLCTSAPPPAVPARNALEVQQLYVAPASQRRGVGRRLMDRAVEFARQGSRDGVWLSVWTDADWATAFYRGYGFAAIGTLPFTLGDSSYTDYLMWLPIET